MSVVHVRDVTVAHLSLDAKRMLDAAWIEPACAYRIDLDGVQFTAQLFLTQGQGHDCIGGLRLSLKCQVPRDSQRCDREADDERDLPLWRVS